MTMKDYPSGCFEVDISGNDCPSVKASAGFMSFTVAEADGALRPNISWAIYRNR
jgi:hypothetical protein